MKSGEQIDRRKLVQRSGAIPDRCWVLLNYDTSQYPFAEVLKRDLYKVPNLGRLHKYVSTHYAKHGVYRQLESKDNLTIRNMMQVLPQESVFAKLYHDFMLRVLSRWVGLRNFIFTEPKDASSLSRHAFG